MGHKWLWIALFTGLLMLAAVGINPPSSILQGPAIAGADKSKGSPSPSNLDVIIIDNKDYRSKRRGPVSFSHLKHARDYGVSCWECHHEFEDKANVWVPWADMARCADCHEPRGDQKMVGLQKAYHMNCRDCHQSLADQKKKTGPHRGCFGCHEKQD